MISPLQLTHGVEWVWLAWLIAVAVLLKMVTRSLRRWRRPRWAELARGEDGVSYSLSYVLVLPILLLFVCIVFETTWLLLAKVGTLYAAHAGARSAVVWSSANTSASDLPTQRINQSVWMAMTPFATGDPKLLAEPKGAVEPSIQYAAAYWLYSQASKDPDAHAPLTTMSKRYLNAASRTTWASQIDKSRPDGAVTVTVTYRAPLHIPGAARLFGNGRDYVIVSKATLPNEAPANDKRSLGIEYKSR
ncbi:MAG TPA: TadE/TadG family type IV pilus assembly protein [Gemmataceae bacterium]|jgi:Flp pilus assembly protein TadG